MDEHDAATGPIDKFTSATCVECGRDLPLRYAIVYHGLVYHPGCVVGAGGSARPAEPRRTDRSPGRREELP